jgi:hypothetical protein
MAGLPSNTVNDPWAPEPELRESPPRRFVSTGIDYPDLNQPSKLIYLGIGAALLIGGLALLFFGLSQGRVLHSILGIVLALGGAVMVGLYPTKIRSHAARAENLVKFGVPVIARVLHAENMTGDSTYSRTVKYQVVLPGGDLMHRTVNVDERLLPARLPADATALLDLNTSEVELYCALPLRAIPKGAPVSHTPTLPDASPGAPFSPPAPATAPSTMTDIPVGTGEPAVAAESGQMGTLDGSAPPVRPVPAEPASKPEPEPAPVEPREEKKSEQPTGSSGLPWE